MERKLKAIRTSNDDALARYGIDPEGARLWRCELDCEAPYPESEIDRRLARLARLEDALFEALGKYNEFARELRHAGLSAAKLECVDAMGGQSRDSGWDPERKEWFYREPYPISKRITEEYTSRPPDGTKALKVWNEATVLAARAPKRVIRIYGEGYCAEFEDRLGRLHLYCHDLPKNAEVVDD